MSTPIPGKRHREFFRLQPDAAGTDWSPVASATGLIEEQLLNDDLDVQRRNGSRTRLARWQPGTVIDRPVVHDFHEEVLVLQGALVVGCDAEGHGGEAFAAPTFACRPPGAVHGPFASPQGCVLLEFQYFA